jgi:dTDP-4-amino-4,6-dideoxygalactose transaminase
MIPSVNLERFHTKIRGELIDAFSTVVDKSAFIGGDFIDEFENTYANLYGTKFFIGCSSGTSALELVLKSLHLQKDDEIIVPNHTWFATVEAIVTSGAVPKLVDVLPNTFQIDVNAVSKAITSKTKAVLAVNMHGNLPDLKNLVNLCNAHDIPLFQDAAQSHLATYDNQAAASFGLASTVSFFPGKNIGALGDAGGIATNNEDLAQWLRKARDHGRISKHLHEFYSSSSRLDSLQGKILSIKAKYAKAHHQNRALIAEFYNIELKGRGFHMMHVEPNVECAWHTYPVIVNEPDTIITNMKHMGVAVGRHYPHTQAEQPAYIKSYGIETFPNSEYICHNSISLPICGELLKSEAQIVLDSFFKVTQGKR